MEQSIVAAERRAGPLVMRRGGERGDREVITIEVPTEEIRRRMDTTRIHVERMLSRVDSLHGRLELLRGDSNNVVFRMERRPGEPLRMRRGGTVHVFSDSAGHRRVLVDSVVVLHDSLMRQHLGRARIEAFPFRDMEPTVPFYMEMGRRGVAGAELVEMNAGLARYFRTERGVLVVQVSEESPMARAGVQSGDVIVRAGGVEVDDVAELRRALSNARDGKLGLEVIRQGNRRTMEMQWDRRPTTRTPATVRQRTRRPTS
jgi:hypothetical protein